MPPPYEREPSRVTAASGHDERVEGAWSKAVGGVQSSTVVV